jgi:RNA polymerase sigma-70 factor (ECF subfamily)
VGEFPDTRRSLVLRIRNRGDEQAWAEFVGIYRPLVYRLTRRRGFQHADAEELAQQAMVAVAGAIERWDPDPQKGTFRGWLFRIARNMMINFLTRSHPDDRGRGGTSFVALLEEQPSRSTEAETLFDREYRRELFRWAAARVREEFHESTWQAFWQTGVEGLEARQVADALDLSLGAVYAAKSRVVGRLKREIRQLQRVEDDGREET